MDILIFTNRVIVVFEENGATNTEMQENLSTTKSYESYKVQEALRDLKFKLDSGEKVKFYLVKWEGWKQELSFIEFTYLLGQGEWFEKLVKAEVAQKIVLDTTPGEPRAEPLEG